MKDFRNRAETIAGLLWVSQKSKYTKASVINRQIKTYRDEKLALLKRQANSEKWGNDRLLNEILSMTYASYIIMLEYRNKVWPYEYMAFARRIGELWEPFADLHLNIL